MRRNLAYVLVALLLLTPMASAQTEATPLDDLAAWIAGKDAKDAAQDAIDVDITERVEALEAGDEPEPPVPPDPPEPGVCTIADTSGCVPATTVSVTDARILCAQPLSDYGPLPVLFEVNFTPGATITQAPVDLFTGCVGDADPSTIDLMIDVEGDGLTTGGADDAMKVRQDARDIQVTGGVDCGPQGPGADGIPGTGDDLHQDGVQLQGGTNIDFVDFRVGDYEAGLSTCQGAGGSMFYSGVSSKKPENVNVIRGEYIACNHGLFGGEAGSSGHVADAKFRTGRTDGSDAKCAVYNSSPPCALIAGAPITTSGLTCQRWNSVSGQFEDA